MENCTLCLISPSSKQGVPNLQRYGRVSRSAFTLKCIVISIAALVSLGVLVAPVSSAEQQGLVGLQFLQSFTEHPPIIDELHFTFRKYLRNGGFEDSRYYCRWQSNAYAITIASKVDHSVTNEFMNINVFAKFGETYWNYHSRHGVLQEWENLNKPEETNNQVLRANMGSLVRLREVLHWGIPHTEIGALEWRETNFASTNSSIGTAVHGSVVSDSLEVVSKIALTVKTYRQNPPMTFIWQITFDYWRDNEFPAQFPRAIYVDLIRGIDDVFRMYDYRDIVIKTNSIPAVAQQFEPDFVLSDTAMVRYFTVLSNQLLLVTESTGRKYIASVQDDPAYARIERQRVWVRTAIMAAALLVLVLIIFFAVTARKRNKSTKLTPSTVTK